MGVIVALVLLLPIVMLVLRARGTTRQPFVRKQLLTKTEIIFFRKLLEAVERLGPYDVFPQVAMGALLDVSSGIKGSDRISLRNRFDRKIVDFVVVDASCEVVAIVELDDRTHVAEKDQVRDSMTAAAGYPTSRFRNAGVISVNAIASQLRPHIEAHTPSAIRTR